jgi:hypothetical protein
MKQYKPKSDLWGKIENRRSFESQLNDLTKKLPIKEPIGDLWNQIEKELDQKPKILPIWIYISIAASIVLILSLGAIFYLQSTSEIPIQDLISENSITNETTNESRLKSIDVENGDSVEIPKLEEEPIDQKVLILPVETKKQTKRVVTNPITISKPSITTINQDLIVVSDANIIQSQPLERSKTLHKVTISWGLNEKTKLRTQFGPNYSDPAFNQQLGRASENKNSIKIKFNKE